MDGRAVRVIDPVHVHAQKVAQAAKKLGKAQRDVIDAERILRLEVAKYDKCVQREQRKGQVTSQP